MNKTWKVLIPVMLSGGLMACSTTGQQPVEPEQKPQIEEPKVEQPEKEVEKETKPEPKPEVKPEEKPKPKPKPQPKKTSDGKLILGEQEWVYVPGLEENFKARIDTGATTSSISATDVVEFERDGKDWVKFKIEHDGVKSKEIALPVERWVKIRQSSAEKSERRAVVESWIQIGDLKEKTEFTLADRTHLKFPLLLGRSFFKDVAVVDVSKKFVQKKHK
ncbi:MULTISPECIES: ATP-dependent zinc protease family protein [Vibrio]|uniref:ATP-dependent zinc protease family protein n=1 Tax=Vibrio TaxID=662 RepID=UPI000586AFB8|nr:MULTISPECIES: ATP-dependent zinc protease [Vibrio]ANW27294.1 ATP-dependent Zn protease [Vibrio coralliilyticus]MCC2521260.1 ATP-dependent zinc protease [Vibrio coralliilyticus]MDE3896811.1 ATP-dependent zinc protease [Vibrio sp. CC007]NOH61271.1 ATP-dependent zinc protease [Vibrio sp. RE88]NOI56135.1 ATP-dependent zinc protease [Vibrio coralliilyticus]